MGEDLHGRYQKEGWPLFFLDFPHEYWKIIHPHFIHSPIQTLRILLAWVLDFLTIWITRSPMQNGAFVALIVEVRYL
jgi:hypothetical protein